MDSSTLAFAAAGSFSTVVLKASKAAWHAVLCTGMEMKWEYSSLYAGSVLLAAIGVKKSIRRCHVKYVTNVTHCQALGFRDVKMASSRCLKWEPEHNTTEIHEALMSCQLDLEVNSQCVRAGKRSVSIKSPLR